MFYSDNAFGQVSTIIHELTHLVRGTVDFTLPDSKKELSKGLTLDSIHDDDKEILNKKFVKYLKTMPRENSVVSAYNYENFIRELLEECYDDTIFTAVR